jgi:hypothetical protein
MKRTISRILIVLLLIILIPFCCLYGTPDFTYEFKQSIVSTPTPDPLRIEITNAFFQYKNGEIPSVDFSAITPFKWDRLYIIGPYPSSYKLNSLFGPSWMMCYTRTFWHDGWVFLVFTSERKIMRCFDYPIDPYNFTSVASEQGIPVEEARFILREELVEFVNSK